MNRTIKKIVNLTPHPININVGDKKMEIPPTGQLARCEESIEEMGELILPVNINGNKFDFVIPLISKKLGNVSGLPEPEEGTVYIVSLPVAQAVKRDDVIAIGETLRDANGRIVGCKSLSIIK